MESYDQLLNEAYEKIKPVEGTSERFEIPQIEGHNEGTKTILTNLPQIASYLRRDINHLLKFLLKELATSGSLKGNAVFLQRKINSQKINEKITEYAKQYVLCKECGKPDTEIIKEKGVGIIHCMACGAKHSRVTKI